MSIYLATVVEVRNYNVVYEVEASNEVEALELASTGEVRDVVDEELETIAHREVISVEEEE